VATGVVVTVVVVTGVVVTLTLPNKLGLVVGAAIDINLLSTFMNPQTEDISIAKSESPNVIDKLGLERLGL